MAGYTPKVGDIFHYGNDENNRLHMTFILAISDQEALIANFSKYYPGTDRTITINVGSYPYISEDSCIPYKFAEIIILKDLSHQIEHKNSIPHKLDQDQITEYLRGLHSSPYTKPYIQTWCKRNGS